MTAVMNNPIIIRDLSKSYGDVQAVKNVSLQVKPGEIYGLIGPDGAGKTTIIRTLVSLLKADKGEVLFQGKDVHKHAVFVRSRIGYMPQRFSLYRDLSVEENLRFFGDLFQISQALQKSRMKKLYNFSKLGPFKNRRAGDLSGGMKQKLALSCMLMHEPEVIVLDEPTLGVDPVSRGEFWEILNNLATGGTTILVSTAYMDEADLCHRTGLIHEGRILAQDRPAMLIENFPFPLYCIRSGQPQKIFEQLGKGPLGDQLQLFGQGVHFVDRNKLGLPGLQKLLKSTGLATLQVEVIKPSLENLFLELMR